MTRWTEPDDYLALENMPRDPIDVGAPTSRPNRWAIVIGALLLLPLMADSASGGRLSAWAAHELRMTME